MFPLRSLITYHQTTIITRAVVVNNIVDHSDVVGAAPVQLHLHYRLNTWLQYIALRQLQDETNKIKFLGFCTAYIRDLTVTT